MTSFTSAGSRSDTRTPQRAIHFCEPLGVRAAELLAHAAAGRIQLEHFAGFRIFDSHETGTGKLQFAWIVQVQAHDVMPRVGEPDLLQRIARAALLPRKALMQGSWIKTMQEISE